MTLSPWLLLALAPFILLFGEFICRHVGVLSRLNVPPPVVGGLSVSLLLLALSLVTGPINFSSLVDAPVWTWLASPEVEWIHRPAKPVHLPFLVAFFTCIGLNATWRVVRAGSWQLVVLWSLAAAVAVLQNLLGITVARLLGVEPLLGLICGSVTMTGGHGTALGFADTIRHAGFPAAAAAGAAAATFGVIAGSVVGNPLGTWLINRHRLRSTAVTPMEGGSVAAPLPAGVLRDARLLIATGRHGLWHLAALAACIKLGAWISYFLQSAGLVFPAYMGALLVGVTARNALDAAGCTWFQSSTIDRIAALALGLFLAMIMSSLNLLDLANAALPMLAILGLQVVVVLVIARWIAFRVLGGDYDAAVMAAGYCGFALGATPNAVANMDSLTRRYGAAPRAYTVVPPVGAFLIDFPNALVITFFINLLAT